MTSKVRKKVMVFFDTNILENRIGDNVILGSQIKLHKNYYNMVRFVEDFNIQDDVELCIPEIVWREILAHCKKTFQSNCQSLNDKIKDWNNIFSDLVNVSYDFHDISQENYMEYLETYSAEFWKNNCNKCKLIQYPRKDNLLDTLIDKVFREEPPFKQTTGNKNKKYSDAGLKDALILETIIDYCSIDDDIGVLFSNDKDFEKGFNDKIEEKFYLVSNIDDLKNLLYKIYSICSPERVKLKIETDYWKEYILKSIDVVPDSSVTEFFVEGMPIKERDNVFSVNVCSIVNETKYLINFKYDARANQIDDESIIYSIEND